MIFKPRFSINPRAVSVQTFLRNEIEGVRNLEGHLGMSACEVALLIADARDDDEAPVLDIDALRRLVVGNAAA